MVRSTRTTRGSLAKAALAAALVGLLAFAGSAAFVPGTSGAQTAPTDGNCDPIYGCPTTTPTTLNPQCEMSVNEARPGDTVTAEVTGVAPGTELQVSFNGEIVASGVADAEGKASIQFTVPNLEEGQYRVFVTGAGVSAECSLDPGFAVLGNEQGNGGGGGLAFTGANVAILVAVGLAMLIAGRAVLESSRRRRRRAARHALGPRAPVG